MQELPAVITDVMMAGGSGLDLLKAVRADSALYGIPVVMITASGVMQTQLEAGEHGADGYLSKPFDRRVVRSTIARLLEKEQEHAKDLLATTVAPYSPGAYRSPGGTFEPYTGDIGATKAKTNSWRKTLITAVAEGCSKFATPADLKAQPSSS